METWLNRLRTDPLELLTRSSNSAIGYLAKRDLRREPVGPIASVWDLPEVHAILHRQASDGRWRYGGGSSRIRSQTDYDQLETYRQLGTLVYRYELDHRHPSVQRAFGFLQTFQTAAGDFRGIYGRQYTPNYSAAITELLIRAGYGSSAQVDRSLRWLIAMRQDDGGWALPLRTRRRSLDVVSMDEPLLEPDSTRPSSHLITGIVLRAFAAHPRWRRRAEIRRAGTLLAGRFFQRDRYPDHQPALHWLVFSFPFWWTDLLSALDSLTRCGFDPRVGGIERALQWFVDHQDSTGLWRRGRNRPKGAHSDEWVGLAICRVLQRAALEGSVSS